MGISSFTVDSTLRSRIKVKGDAVREHPRTRRTRDEALIDDVLGKWRRRFHVRESRLRRPTLYGGKIDTTRAVTQPTTNH
jgi:hypothetical protein